MLTWDDRTRQKNRSLQYGRLRFEGGKQFLEHLGIRPVTGKRSLVERSIVVGRRCSQTQHQLAALAESAWSIGATAVGIEAVAHSSSILWNLSALEWSSPHRRSESPAPHEPVSTLDKLAEASLIPTISSIAEREKGMQKRSETYSRPMKIEDVSVSESSIWPPVWPMMPMLYYTQEHSATECGIQGSKAATTYHTR